MCVCIARHVCLHMHAGAAGGIGSVWVIHRLQHACINILLRELRTLLNYVGGSGRVSPRSLRRGPVWATLVRGCVLVSPEMLVRPDRDWDCGTSAREVSHRAMQRDSFAF